MSAETRKDQIVATASELFRLRGYQSTSVRDIARELDLQGGSLYAHIASKDAVLREIVRRAAAAFSEAVAPIAAEPGPAAERLRRMVHAHIDVVVTRLNDATVFFQDWRHLNEPGRAEVLTLRDNYEALFRQVLAEGVARGEFSERDPRLMSILLLSALNALPGWYQPNGPLSSGEIAEEFADIFLRGLAA
jgi:AcrR family transcriptional regulator